jgi:hypothetical protein
MPSGENAVICDCCGSHNGLWSRLHVLIESEQRLQQAAPVFALLTWCVHHHICRYLQVPTAA